VGVCFNSLPSQVSFLYGPLDAEYTPKVRKMPERRKKQTQVESANEEEEEPEDMDQTGKKKESDGNELSAVEKHIKIIRKTLSERSGEEREMAMEKAEEYKSQISQENTDERAVEKQKKRFVKENSQVNAVNCLFNPKSFSRKRSRMSFTLAFWSRRDFRGLERGQRRRRRSLGVIPGR
jgi:hypothetical protein